LATSANEAPRSHVRLKRSFHTIVQVETHELTKRYREVTALDHCTLGVERGEVFGLLGPNGAGKTTLLRLLMGFLHPSSGFARIDGLDCCRQSLEVRRRVAYLPGEARLFRQMRAKRVLRFFAEIRPGTDYRRSLEIAERLELNLNRRVAFMSTGMRQKLALAATLAADTPLIILDEPTSNLDPTVRGVVSQLVLEAKRNGRTVIFSSHVLSEVEEVCDRVAFLQAGCLIHTQVMSELRQYHRVRATLDGPLPAPPPDLAQDVSVRRSREGAVAIETAGDLAPLLGWLSTLALGRISVEPVGLRALYDRLHDEGEAGRPLPSAREPAETGRAEET
jgi:ABC-2 type transport system ATP-binding protein